MRFQQRHHFFGKRAQAGKAQRLGLLLHQRHKARHMGAFLLRRQINRHGELCHGVLGAVVRLDGNGKTQVFDAHLIDGHIALVGAALHVGNGIHAVRFLGVIQCGLAGGLGRQDGESG